MGEGPLQCPNPCVHLCPSYLLRVICLPPIFVGKDEDEHSVHLKVTCAQCMSLHSWWHIWKIFYCSYFVQRFPHSTCLLHFNTFSTCLMRDPASTKTQQLAVQATSLAIKESAASSGMWVWIQFFLLLSHTEGLDQHNLSSTNLSSWWSHPGLGVQGLLTHLVSHHGMGP